MTCKEMRAFIETERKKSQRVIYGGQLKELFAATIVPDDFSSLKHAFALTCNDLARWTHHPMSRSILDDAVEKQMDLFRPTEATGLEFRCWILNRWNILIEALQLTRQSILRPKNVKKALNL